VVLLLAVPDIYVDRVVVQEEEESTKENVSSAE
jgi:hypothetical protein